MPQVLTGNRVSSAVGNPHEQPYNSIDQQIAVNSQAYPEKKTCRFAALHSLPADDQHKHGKRNGDYK